MRVMVPAMAAGRSPLVPWVELSAVGDVRCEGMVPAARWLVVALVAVGVRAAPALLPAACPRARAPTSSAGRSPSGSRVAADVGWSGEVRDPGLAARCR